MTRQKPHRMSPVEKAVFRNLVLADIAKLRTAAGLQSYVGDMPERVTNLLGRLVFVTAYAAGLHKLDGTPEASILAGSANALAELADHPSLLEDYRATLIACLGAIDRLMPQLSAAALAAGALELDALLAKGDMYTSDVQRALKRKVPA
jgi:hypothetical protein